MLTETKRAPVQARSVQPQAFTSIVPGDKIRPRSKEQFDEDALIEALDKRYRNEPVVEGEIIDQALTMMTLAEAVEFVKDYLVKREGHDRDVIFNQQELRARAFTLEATSVMSAVMAELAKGKATDMDIKRVVRQQVGLRKINRMPEILAGTLTRALKDEGFIFLQMGREPGWSLKKNVTLEPHRYEGFYKFALRIE